MKNKGYAKCWGPNKVHYGKWRSGVFALFASFASQNCRLFILQPFFLFFFFDPRSVLQANLRNKINFLSAYCHIHWTWV